MRRCRVRSRASTRPSGAKVVVSTAPGTRTARLAAAGDGSREHAATELGEHEDSPMPLARPLASKRRSGPSRHRSRDPFAPGPEPSAQITSLSGSRGMEDVDERSIRPPPRGGRGPSCTSGQPAHRIRVDANRDADRRVAIRIGQRLRQPSARKHTQIRGDSVLDRLLAATLVARSNHDDLVAARSPPAARCPSRRARPHPCGPETTDPSRRGCACLELGSDELEQPARASLPRVRRSELLPGSRRRTATSSRSASSTAAMNASGSSATTTCGSIPRSSGRPDATTGFPAARYSNVLSGKQLRV